MTNVVVFFFVVVVVYIWAKISFYILLAKIRELADLQDAFLGFLFSSK